MNRKIILHLLEKIKVDLHEIIVISSDAFINFACLFVSWIFATSVVGKSITRLSENMRTDQQ